MRLVSGRAGDGGFDEGDFGGGEVEEQRDLQRILRILKVQSG